MSVWGDWIKANTGSIFDEFDRVTEENEQLKKELAEATTKADVYKRDAENLQRTLEEAGEKIEELEQQLAELPKKICAEFEKQFFNIYNLTGVFTSTALRSVLWLIQEKYSKGETK